MLRTQVADARAVPFDDTSFDVVLSTIGAMFAPDQQAVGLLWTAAEETSSPSLIGCADPPARPWWRSPTADVASPCASLRRP